MEGVAAAGPQLGRTVPCSRRLKGCGHCILQVRRGGVGGHVMVQRHAAAAGGGGQRHQPPHQRLGPALRRQQVAAQPPQGGPQAGTGFQEQPAQQAGGLH